MQVGTAGIAGLSLSSWMATKATASQSEYVKDRSVVVLNLQGGPTQFETFDPKMEAPSEIRSIFGQIPTSMPGVFFGSQFPKIASLNRGSNGIGLYAGWRAYQSCNRDAPEYGRYSRRCW